MCKDCGCQEANLKLRAQWTAPSEPLQFRVPTQISEHSHDHSHTRTLTLEKKVLDKNDSIAQKNREWFQRKQIRVMNLMSSPGAGKTYLLEKTIEKLSDKNKVSIITGDQEKDFDAQRLLARGAHVKQLNTISSCHLDAAMIQNELDQFIRPENTELLIIENVGNLVCPAAFDLGESFRVALLSTTEGEDKPSKYPLLFHTADLIVITKIDLVPYLDWNRELCHSHIRKVNSQAQILEISAKTGEGMSVWLDLLLS